MCTLLKFFAAFLLVIFMMFSVTPSAFAEEASSSKESLPQVHGEAAYLVDVQSGQTLFMKNPDKPLAPASTTKIMTGLLAIEHGNMSDIVTASSTMLNNKLVYGTQIYLQPSETMLFKDLLYAMFLNSANDAAVAIAEHIGGDLPHFVDMMNQRAREIGANQTHFLNPSGLTELGHVTTAHDLALIALVAYQNPMFAQYVRTKTQTISRSKAGGPVLMVNENKLLWKDTTIDGIKTGYTAVAQNCLVASMSKDGRQFIGVILKSPGREIYTDMQDMFNYGFTQFKDTVFKPSGTVISSITVNNEPVDLILDRPIYRTQKLTEQPTALHLRVVPSYTNALTAVEKGQVVAHVEVLDGETLINTIPLKSSQSIQPQIPKKVARAYHLPWINGLILFIGVILVLILRQKIYADRHWRRQIRTTKRRGSNR